MTEFRNPRGRPETYETHMSRLGFEAKTLRRALRLVKRYDRHFDGGASTEDMQQGLEWLLEKVQDKMDNAKLTKVEDEEA